MKFTLFSILAFLPFTVFAGIQVVSQSPNSLSLDIQLENVSEMPDTVGTHDYMLYRFDDGIMEEQTGKPALPYLLYSLAVPPKARITYQVSVLQSDAREGVDVVPQNRVFIRGGIKEMPRDEDIYSGSIPYPEERVRLGEPQNFRGANVAQLRINPIQYFPAAHRVLINKHLRIDFKFEDTAASAAAPAGRPIRDKVLSQKLVNYQQAQGFASPVKVSFAKAAANYDFSSGQWFRFPVKEDGVYQITGSFLKSKGVDIGEIQLSGVHLYNYGGYLLSYNVNEARPGDLNEIAVQVVDDNQNGVMDESDRIIFYGKGLGGWKYDANSHRWDYENFPYDDANYYLFTFDSQPGKRIQSMDSPNLQNLRVPAEFMDYLHFESDRYNILSSGLDWYWIRMSGMQDKKSLTFSLPQNLANDTLRMYFHFKGGSGSDYGDDANYVYRIKTILNQQVLFDNLTFSRAGHGYREIRYNNLQSAKGGDNDLELYLTGNLDGCEAYLDYFNVQVNRPFVAENKALRFRDIIPPETPVEYHLSGFPGGANTVWDISDLSNVKNIQPLQNGQSVRFQDAAADWKGADYFVFSPDVIKNVDAIEPIENHANLRDPSRRAEFIIITPDEFYDQAEFLENRRESQVPNPIETERVRMSDIFDEFSSSVRDITAIRDFLKYAYENWSDSLQYVLLFGDGHYDYRNILLKDMPDYIPPFEISNDYEIDSREADNYYVAFGNTGNLSNLTPWLPLARLPFNNPEQIAVYREKADHYAKSFLLNPDKNGWQTWVTLVADDQYGGGGTSSEWYHLQPTELVNKKYIPEKFNRAKIYLHDYDRVAGGLGRLKPKATEDLINQLNRGTLLINYFGHGDPDTWAHEYLLVRSRDLPRIHNEDRLPLWVAATCTWGKFDDPNHNSMSEELLWLSQRGGIGVVSAGRPVYVNSNTALAESLYNNLFHGKSDSQPSMRLGDAMFLSMNGGINYQKYHLYADPTMHLADPQYSIKIESIEPDTLKALATVKVEAAVTDQSGTPLNDFSGSAVLQVFDAVDSLYVPAANVHYTYNGGTVFKGLVSVKNGQLTGNFIVPKSIKYKASKTGRLSIYAWSDKGSDAIGYVDTLLFYGTEKVAKDENGPEIDVSFKEVPNFFDGDFVSSQPTLQVEIADPSGINLTGEVGHQVELTIDGNVKKNMTEFFVYDADSYQKGKLEYTLPALSGGNHQIKVECWDNLNNYSERLITFRTSSGGKLAMNDVVNFPNPFSRDTYFTFQLVSAIGEADVTINIYTVTGRKIQEIKGIAREGFNKIYWDGLDWDGDVIANGVYLYKVIVDDGENRLEKIDKLAVVR